MFLANKAAHGLVQYASNISDFVTWIEGSLSIIEHSLAFDVMFLSSSE